MDVSQSAAVVLNSGILNSSREVKTETPWERIGHQIQSVSARVALHDSQFIIILMFKLF